MSDPNPSHTSRHPLLTVAGVAKILNVSPRSVRRLIKDVKLPVVHVGRLVRIRPEALEAFINGG
jgi:excisionase family DNA binding protein